MLKTFSFNLLFNNAKFYLSPPSGTPLGSRNNSYESLKDASDITFSTPSSSPRTPGPETLPSQTVLPSLAPPVTAPTTVLSSLSILPFPSSQTSLAPKPDPAVPSLLDTSISFARMMDRTGSPASFLTCSSGWDPGIVCGAVTFPSLLHSRPSIDNFPLAQETHHIPSDPQTGAEYSLWRTKSPPVSQSPSKLPFSVATPFYFSPSLWNAELVRFQPPDLVASAPPRTALEPQLSSPTNSRYSATSPQTASPGSAFSLGESTTSSTYGDPFHWDTVLAGLPPSPQRSPALAFTVGEHLSIRLSPSTSPVPSFSQYHAICAHSPEQGSIRSTTSTASPGTIPTIVVHNPDSVMMPTPASVSSIIGLYGGRCESTQMITREISALELQAPEKEPEQELDEGDTDGGASSPESEFEIVAVSALKVRLDTILETDELEVENAFGSLKTLGSIASGNTRISAAEGQTSTESLANAFPSFSSSTEPPIDATSAFLPGRTVQSNPKVSASTSFASTAKLFYAQSGTSISGESTTSSCQPTASGSESDCPWLFYVEDGKILEAPQSTSVHGGGKFADKLARFPNVPKSPQLTPLPSPSPTNRYFLDGSHFTSDVPEKKLGGTTSLGVADAVSLLSPHWGRNTAGWPTTFSPGISTPYQPITSAESSSIAEISFGELDVDLGLSRSFGSLAPDSLPTDSSSSSGYSTKLSIAQSATPSYGRHVRFESADFRTSSVAVGPKRRPPLTRSKTCLKKKRLGEETKDWRNSSGASTALVRSPGVDCGHLPSSFSSSSISKWGSRWQNGRFLVVMGRVRRGIRGCLSLQEEDTFGGSAWATERDYWDDHLAEGESKRPGNLVRDDDGGALLQRIRRYT